MFYSASPIPIAPIHIAPILLRYRINYDRKKIYRAAPGVVLNVDRGFADVRMKEFGGVRKK
jgi:hypothetical protein